MATIVQLVVDVKLDAGTAAEADDIRERIDSLLHRARQRGDFLPSMSGSETRLVGVGKRSDQHSWQITADALGWHSREQRQVLERFIFERADLSAALGAFVEEVAIGDICLHETHSA
jgi:hypothetical protein